MAPPKRERKTVAELTESLRDHYSWSKVDRAYPWRPKEPGDELVGFYGGLVERSGPRGLYEAVLVMLPDHRGLTVSGVVIIDLISVAQV